MSETEKKVPFYQIAENYIELINQATGKPSPLAKVIFENHTFPHKFHVEESEEGSKIYLEEMDDGIMRYVSEDKVIDSLTKYSVNLPAAQYKSYKLDWDKSKKIVKMWKSATPPFPHEIKPILQKDTVGYTFHRLDFNMVAQETPTFDYLVECLQTNKEAFMAYLGAMFDPHKTPQQYLWLSGSGGDGKGAIFRLIKKLFKNAYTSVSTEPRDIDKYWQSSLVGKRVAVCGDTKNLGFINRSIFMQITGGDPVSVRRMNRESYTVELNSMFVFGANAEPEITTEDSGRRRAIICRLDRSRHRYIENIEDKIWLERAGIVHKCVEEWKKVRHLLYIPVDQESLSTLGEGTEEFHQQLLDRYFATEKGVEIKASDIITILKEGEKKQLNGAEFGAWKRWLDRTYGITCSRVKRDGKKIRVYKGMRDKLKARENALALGDLEAVPDIPKEDLGPDAESWDTENGDNFQENGDNFQENGDNFQENGTEDCATKPDIEVGEPRSKDEIPDLDDY